MKTRENELHKPKVIYEPAHGSYSSWGMKYCSVCGYHLNWKFGCTKQEIEELYVENQCPYCGARLKDIEE